MDILIYFLFFMAIVVYITVVALNIILSATALIYCILVLMGYQGKWRDRTYEVLYPLVWPVLLVDAVFILSIIL